MLQNVRFSENPSRFPGKKRESLAGADDRDDAAEPEHPRKGAVMAKDSKPRSDKPTFDGFINENGTIIGFVLGAAFVVCLIISAVSSLF